MSQNLHVYRSKYCHLHIRLYKLYLCYYVAFTHGAFSVDFDTLTLVPVSVWLSRDRVKLCIHTYLLKKIVIHVLIVFASQPVKYIHLQWYVTAQRVIDGKYITSYMSIPTNLVTTRL